MTATLLFVAFAVLMLAGVPIGAALGLAGTAAIAVIGILFFREDVSAIKVISIGLIVLGVIGVNLGGVRH